MSLPQQDLTPFTLRRQRLQAKMQELGGGIAIIPTHAEINRNADNTFPFRFNSDFYYLSGFTEPDACLIVLAGEDNKSILFCRNKDETREIWDGYRFGPQKAQEHFAFDEAYDINDLEAHLSQLVLNQTLLFTPLQGSKSLERSVRQALQNAQTHTRSGQSLPKKSYDLTHLIAEMRLIKDASELATMRAAGKISAAAHRRAMQHCRPGLREYHIEAELLHEFRYQGAQSPAYSSIVATGKNACVLHYRAGDSLLSEGDLLLIDAAAELDGYASDITRTFPVNGKFSGAQRELYTIVLAAQNAAIAHTSPQHHWNAGHEAAVKVLTQGMIDVGLLHGDLEELIATQGYSQFYMHRTGHWLGLDVHDVGDYRDPTASNPRPWRQLQEGMTLTIEPGIYVRPADNVPEEFWNIGIRIEDNAVVTAQGCELITRDVPVDPDDIEALMRA